MLLRINTGRYSFLKKVTVLFSSMGGHGALICALKNPGMFRSVSAFAPICNPIKCPWGQKAFTGYLGTDTQMWEQYDATSLIAKYSGPSLELFVDQVHSLLCVCVCGIHVDTFICMIEQELAFTYISAWRNVCV